MPPAIYAPRPLIALIAATTVLPLCALLWLGWELTDQDRRLQIDQGRARVERAADGVVAALQRAISVSEQRLAAGVTDWPDDAVALTLADDHVTATPPGRLSYLPAVQPQRAPPPHVFDRAEELEFAAGDHASAIAAYRRLTRSPDPAIRAGALLRLARNLRRSDPQGAFAAYTRLGEISGISERGVPVDLIARYGRCALLEGQLREEELRAEATRLAHDLAGGRWPIDGAVYALYIGDAHRWSGVPPSPLPSATTYADAAARLWHEWRDPRLPTRAARGSLHVKGAPLAVLWQATATGPRVLIAGPAFVEAEWLRAVFDVAQEHGVRVSLADDAEGSVFGSWTATLPPILETSANRLTAARSAASAGLPWTITVTADGSPEAVRFAERRRLLIAGFALLVFMTLVASYLIVRALGRELAVARLRADFVAAVSHEFRTPLTSLRQFTDMLRDRPWLDDERRRLCYEAQARATERLTRLVESVLDLGRIEAGARTYAFERQDATAFALRTVDEFRRQPEADGRAIAFSDNGPIPIEADDEALSRALWNLLDNAVKYSPEGRPVQVAVTRAEHAAVIAVRDTGIGLAPDERRTLFTKFKRGEEAVRRGIKGTGIGLAMAHEIVKAHGGRIEVQSARDSRSAAIYAGRR